MPPRHARALRERTVDELTVDDERSFRHVALYADLKEILVRDRYLFRVLPAKSAGRWDRALLLNLTYWGGVGGDVLEDEHVAADVVAHAAWHHLAARAVGLAAGHAPCAEALFLGESIASAFDLYLVGRLLGHAPRSSFLSTQVPAMAQAASAAELGERQFASLLLDIARDPPGAFADLRRLLYDATLALLPCRGVDDAFAALTRFDAHRFGALLHHYELSNWVLYARAYAGKAQGPARKVVALEAKLRAADDALGWLTSTWVAPALARPFAGRERARTPAESAGRAPATRTRSDRARRQPRGEGSARSTRRSEPAR